jgi:hypothetical protein
MNFPQLTHYCPHLTLKGLRGLQGWVLLDGFQSIPSLGSVHMHFVIVKTTFLLAWSHLYLCDIQSSDGI